MTLVCSINGTPLPDAAVLRDRITGFPSSAWYGEPMTAGLVIDDPEGAYELQGWSVFTVDETDCVDNERIFTGWITGKTISRGPYKSGDARQWDCDIIDQNACLSFQIFRANSAKRPAETDLARFTFLKDSAPMAYTPVYAGALTNLTDNPANLQEADHTRQYPVEAFTSTAGRSGKFFYVYWNDDNARLEYFYDLPSAFPACSIQISNVIADVDDDVIWFPSIDASLSRSPENVYTGELLDYVGGAVFVERQATIDALSPTPLSPVEWRRDFHRTSDQIGRNTTALSLAAADLEAFATEEDTITVTLRLPSTHVNFVEAGQTIPAKFTHLPGYELGPDVRVIRRNVVPAPIEQDAGPKYDVTLELSNKVKIRDIDGGPPGVFPPRRQCDVADVTIVQQEHDVCDVPLIGHLTGASWSTPPTPGHRLVCVWAVVGHDTTSPSHLIGSMDGWDQCGPGAAMVGSGGSSGTVMIFTKIAGFSEPTQVEATGGAIGQPAAQKGNCYLFEIAGVDAFDVSTEAVQTGAIANTIGSTITPTSNKVAFLLSAFVVNQAAGGFAFPITPAAGVTELYEELGLGDSGNPGRWLGYRIVADTTGSYAMSGTENIPGATFDWAWVAISLTCSGGDLSCPAAGQWVDWFFLANGDGTTMTFTVPCPYADGGIMVKVDNLDVTLGLTESDPAAGEFTLDFAPKAAQGDAPAEQVWVRYQGR